MNGTVKKIMADKGFGFIAVDGGADLFFHMSAVENDGFSSLREGQSVTFSTEQSPKGQRAINVMAA